MNTYLMNNQQIMYQNPAATENKISNQAPLVTIMNPVTSPVSTAGSVMTPNSIHLMKKNYTYTAHVNIPNTHTQHNYLRLPRVLPPPSNNNNNNTYTTAMPVFSNRRDSFISPISDTSSPLGRDSTSPYLPSFKTFNESRRHSISLAVLCDPSQPNKDIEHPEFSSSLSLIEQNKLLTPTIKLEQETHLPKPTKLVYNEGENYNLKGELIGRSGKVLRDTKRAAQNRCAQKAFRIRREKYIRNLEAKSTEFDKMVGENSNLKIKIKELEKKLQELKN